MQWGCRIWVSKRRTKYLANTHVAAVSGPFCLTRMRVDGLKRTGTPLASLETQRPLAHFEILAFSLSFETDYLHVLDILAAAHIPVRAAERTAQHPLVIAGGPATFLNPEPLADFIDLFLIGEGEEMVPEFLEQYASLPPPMEGENGTKSRVARVKYDSWRLRPGLFSASLP